MRRFAKFPFSDLTLGLSEGSANSVSWPRIPTRSSSTDATQTGSSTSAIQTAAQIPGTENADILIGTSASDSMFGLGGDDVILSGAGADVVSGGSGNDIVLAGAGDDRLIYSSADNQGTTDVYYGGAGRDTLRLYVDGTTWFDAAFQAELAAFLDQVGSAQPGATFTFASLGLTVQQIEAVEVFVDGIQLDPTDQPALTTADTAEIGEDSETVTGNVLANDTVLDLVATVLLDHDATWGHVEIAADGTFIYHLNNTDQIQSLAQGQFLTDSFTYRLVDADGDVAVETVTVTVLGMNDAAIFADGRLAAREGGALAQLDLATLADDMDYGEDGTTLLYAISGTPDLGIAAISGHMFSFDPGTDFEFLAANQTYTVNIEVTAMDSVGTITTATMAVTVTGRNNAPELAGALLRIGQDGAQTVLDLATVGSDADSDDNGATLSYAITGQPLEGTAAISGRMLVFIPGSDFDDLAQGETRDVAVEVTATDAHGATVTSIVTVRVTGTNDSPAVTDATMTAREDGGAVTLDLSTLTDDPDGDTLTYAITGQPAEGVASLNGSTLQFNPGSGFQDLDLGETRDVQITVRATDSFGATTTGTITVTVTGKNDAPTVLATTMTAAEDGAVVSLDLATLASDPEGDTLTYEIIGQPSEGSVSIVGSTLQFNPGDDFQDLDLGETRDVQVRVRALDSHGTAGANTITIRVTGKNDAPTVQSATMTAAEDGAVVSLDLATLASDPEGDALTYEIVGQPSEGSVSIVGSTLQFNPGNDFQDLDLGETRDVQVRVRALDSHGTAGANTITIRVTGKNDAPTVQAATMTAAEDGAVTSLDLATLASDPEGDALTFEIVGQPSEGTVSIVGSVLQFDPGDDFQDLDVGETRDVQVRVRALDSHGTAGANTITIRVTGTNDAPTVAAGAMTAVEDRAVVSLDLTTLASDPEGDALTFEILAQPSEGSVTLDGSVLQFNPGDDFQDLSEGETRDVQVRINALDSHGSATAQTVTITVTGTDDAPVLTAGSMTAKENREEVRLDLTTLLTDVDGTTTGVSFAIAGTPTEGSARIEGTDLVFDPGDDFQDLNRGTSRDVTISVLGYQDGVVTTANTVTVRVGGTNDAPVLSSVTWTLTQNDQVTIDLSALVTDIDDDSGFTFEATTTLGSATIDGSTLTFDPNGDFDYLAQVGQSGAQSTTTDVWVTVTDPQGGSTSTRFTFTITGVNDAPVYIGSTDPIQLTEDADPIVFYLSSLFEDPDADTMYYELVSAPDKGTVTVNTGSGKLTFDPGLDFTGLIDGETETVSVVVRAVDKYGASTTQTIEFEVTGEGTAIGSNPFGFEILGSEISERTGKSVAGVGDVDGDGIDDLLVGSGMTSGTGTAFLLSGRDQEAGDTFPAYIVPATSADGTTFEGAPADKYFADTISAGDINGDGLEDLLIANTQYENGTIYVVFGTEDGFDRITDISYENLDGTNGFRILGSTSYVNIGENMVSADVNGDGLDDILYTVELNPLQFDYGDDSVRIIYGTGSPTDATTSAAGDTIIWSATSVGLAGDLNADGTDDFIVDNYVVFGQSGTALDAGEDFLDDLDGTDGTQLLGLAGDPELLSANVDINGDGFADLVVGDPTANKVYVVLATDTGFDATIDLTALDGTDGFVLNGVSEGDEAGHSISGAGDVNGDGIEDLIIGAWQADGTGAAYLVFGSGSGFDAQIDLGALDGTDGYILLGEDIDDTAGSAVSGAGDINNDGYDDLLISAWAADVGDTTDAGKVYVVYGGPTLSDFDADDGVLDGTIHLSGLSSDSFIF